MPAKTIDGRALVLVGENPSSISYVRSKGDAAEEAGIFSETFHHAVSITQDELISRVLDVDEDARFHALPPPPPPRRPPGARGPPLPRPPRPAPPAYPPRRVRRRQCHRPHQGRR